MAVRVLPLKGLKSIWALNAYNTLLFGLATEQALTGQPFEETYKNFEALPLEAKELQLRRAISIVNLPEDDMRSLICFAQDANGVPFTDANTARMSPEDIVEVLTAVCLEISKIKIRSISDDVKKTPALQRRYHGRGL
ncbi:hypothetical protein AAIR98_001334 [Elusimicrobium simillimum]|uniref:hypothetical protein n=1 Tax=Elusimicrobium simillimum TaxID=3143438 RepID=UPI003C6EDEA0